MRKLLVLVLLLVVAGCNSDAPGTTAGSGDGVVTIWHDYANHNTCYITKAYYGRNISCVADH